MAIFVIRPEEAAGHSGVYKIYLASEQNNQRALVDAHLKLIRTRDPQDSLAGLVTRLIGQLEALDAPEEPLRNAFWSLLSDPYLMQQSHSLNFLNIAPGALRLDDPDLLTLCVAFYKAIFLFLNNNDRHNARETWLASLYAVWQWHQLVKFLLMAPENESSAGQTVTPVTQDERTRLREDWRASLRRELDSAYRYLLFLIDDPRFSQAIRWMASWNYMVEEEYGSGPLLREQIRLSLLLWEEPAPSGPAIEPRKPIPGPGSLANTRPRRRFTRLHPAYTFPARKRIVRQLITEWLLPRYDFANAIWLAMLLKENRVGISRLSVLWFSGLWAVFPMAAVVIGSFCARGWPLLDSGAQFMGTILLEIVVGFGIPIYLTVSKLEVQVLGNFLLPRVIGGVFIGYLTLALQNDSVAVSNAIWSRGWLLVAALWVAVLMIGFAYLYFDTRPLVRDHRTAFERAGGALLIAVIIALLAGLISVALTSKAYGLQAMDGGQLGAFLGPFGWVDITQYLTFAPIALFTGLVTQFIFEELTLPSSVWSPEQE